MVAGPRSSPDALGAGHHHQATVVWNDRRVDDQQDPVLTTVLGVVVVAATGAAVVVLLAGPGGLLAPPAVPGVGSAVPAIAAALAAAVLGIGGAVTAIVRRQPMPGWSAALLAITSLAALASGTTVAQPLLPALAAAALPVSAVALLATTRALGLSQGWLARDRRLSAGVMVVAIVGVALAIGRFAAYDPFLDPACGGFCARADPWLPLSAASGLAMGRAVGILQLGVGGTATVLAVVGLSRPETRPPARRAAVAGLAVMGVADVTAGALILTGSHGQTAAAVVLLDAIGMATVGGALLWSVIEHVRLRARLVRLAGDIVSADAFSVERGLAAALGDGYVAVAYPLPDGAGRVDAQGDPVDGAPAGDDIRETAVRWHGHPVAAIRHRPDLDPAAIEAGIPPALLVAMDNQRLRAISLASLRALRASRARIVAAEDEERRRVERDLHDGAQQRMLAIAFELRLAGADADRNGDAQAAVRFATAERSALLALDELRRVARGVHPAILGQSGLAAALSSFAEDAPVPITLELDRSMRLPPLVEATAYQVATQAVSDAAAAGATEVTIAAARDGDVATLDIDLDGVSVLGSTVRIEDRVGALGGDVTVDRASPTATRIRAVMPCA